MDNAPRGPRIVVNHPAVLTDKNGTAFDCAILDVSKHGFRLKVPRPLPVGVGYTLHFDNQTHEVEVRWASPTEVGGMFIQPVSS